jgi:stage III sporulation protein AF
MINFFREWIFNLAAVSIVLVLINTLAPTGKSKKVIDLVSGFILILTIVQPFFNLFLSNFNLDEIYDQNDRYLNAIITETGKLGENAKNWAPIADEIWNCTRACPGCDE